MDLELMSVRQGKFAVHPPTQNLYTPQQRACHKISSRPQKKPPKQKISQKKPPKQKISQKKKKKKKRAYKQHMKI